MKISVFGAGYVGLVQAAGLASTGNTVFAADVNEEKLKLMREGKSPIFEAGLEELIQSGLEHKRLHFLHAQSPEFLDGLQQSEVIFIAVGTPEKPDGSSDLSYLYSALDRLAEVSGDLSDKVVVVKSTVPIGTGDEIEKYLANQGKKPVVASNPEFLKQGTAVQDFLKPERVIIGTLDQTARDKLEQLHRPFMLRRERILFMSRRSAELVKYACNSFLATKISFINEMACLAEAFGADIREIRMGMITDSRIGEQFLFPGIGYGGSCLPKDTHALLVQGKAANEPMHLINAVDLVNRRQRDWLVNRLEETFAKDLSSKVIALWGLSFKPNTDDLREAPSLNIISKLLELGVKIKAHDPVAMENTKKHFQQHPKFNQLTFFDNAYETTQGADALCILTEWHEYRSPDFEELKKRLKLPLILDGRNIIDASLARKHGFQYRGVGIRV